MQSSIQQMLLYTNRSISYLQTACGAITRDLLPFWPYFSLCLPFITNMLRIYFTRANYSFKFRNLCTGPAQCAHGAEIYAAESSALSAACTSFVCGHYPELLKYSFAPGENLRPPSVRYVGNDHLAFAAGGVYKLSVSDIYTDMVAQVAVIGIGIE